MQLAGAVVVVGVAILVVAWFMFNSLAARALEQNNRIFLELASQRLDNARAAAANDLQARKQEIEALVNPLGESLKAMTSQINELENARKEAYGGLSEQLTSLATTSSQLRSETASLVGALRAPKVRGAWGQIQLKRVVELAGMVDHCDFFEQETFTTEDGMVRPDLRVLLPGNRNVVVDSKVPLDAYLEALDAKDEDTRIEKLKQHAVQVRARVDELKSKRYWQHLQPTPEFVVLFLPAESFFDAALRFDPALIEQSAAEKVIIATPTTLIALLKAVAYGWKQQQVEENAKKISDEGRLLYDRLANFTSFLRDLGGSLQKAVDDFNKAVGSFESRLIVSARRLRDLGAGAEAHLADLKPIDSRTRDVAGRAGKEPPEEEQSL